MSCQTLRTVFLGLGARWPGIIALSSWLLVKKLPFHLGVSAPYQGKRTISPPCPCLKNNLSAFHPGRRPQAFLMSSQDDPGGLCVFCVPTGVSLQLRKQELLCPFLQRPTVRSPAGAHAALSVSPARSHRPGQTLEESSFSSLRAKQLVGGSSSPLNQLSCDSGRSAYGPYVHGSVAGTMAFRLLRTPAWNVGAWSTVKTASAPIHPTENRSPPRAVHLGPLKQCLSFRASCLIMYTDAGTENISMQVCFWDHEFAFPMGSGELRAIPEVCPQQPQPG